MLCRYFRNNNIFIFQLTEDSQLVPENVGQRKHRPQAATAGRSKNSLDQAIDLEDEQSTIS